MVPWGRATSCSCSSSSWKAHREVAELTDYRVLTKKQALALFAVLIGTGAVIVWFGLAWVEGFSERMSELAEARPAVAAAALARQLRFVAILNGLVLGSLAAVVTWHGIKGIRTQSMPPKGSWIIDGQRVRTGPGAVVAAKLLVAAGVVLALLAVVSSLVMLALAERMNGVSHEMTQLAMTACASISIFSSGSASACTPRQG